MKKKSNNHNGKIIRPGNRKPFRKGTYEQVQERIDFVAGMMEENPTVTRGQIKRAVKRKYDIEFRQCAEYITCAKLQLAKRNSMSKTEVKNVVFNACLTSIRLKRNMISAAHLMAELGDLFPAKRIEQTGADGGPIKIEDARPLKDTPAERIRELANMDASLLNGKEEK